MTGHDDRKWILPERLRDPVIQCLVLERKQDDAARVLGLHPRTLKRRLCDARFYAMYGLLRTVRRYHARLLHLPALKSLFLA